MININISVISSFIAGLLTFFAPCTFVMLPAFISYLTNTATYEAEHPGHYRRHILVSTILYILAFLLVFTAMGMSATALGRLFIRNQDLLAKIGGLSIFGFGLILIAGNARKLNFLFIERKIEINTDSLRHTYIFPVILGLTSAFAWTPCIGPVLGGILFLAGSTTDQIVQGGFLLFVYGLGINLPFFFMSLSLAYAQKFVNKFKKWSAIIQKISGLLLVIIGLGIFLELNYHLFSWLFKIFTFFGYQPA